SAPIAPRRPDARPVGRPAASALALRPPASAPASRDRSDPAPAGRPAVSAAVWPGRPGPAVAGRPSAFVPPVSRPEGPTPAVCRPSGWVGFAGTGIGVVGWDPLSTALPGQGGVERR